MVLEDYSGNYIAIEQRIKIAEKALNLLHYQGKWTEFYFLITQFIKEIDDKPCLNLLIMLGRHYAHQRNKQLALTTLYRAYNIAIESNDTAKAAECKMRIGHALTLVGEFASAREELQIATDLANEVNDKNTIISATGYLSDIDIQQGNYTKAIETLMSFRYEWDRASGYYNCMIGDAYNAKGDIEQALLYYKEAERLSLEWQDKRLQAWAYAGFAECGQGSNYAEEAKTVFNLCRMEREYDRIMHFQIANDYKVSHPQKIFIIGAPAAGKSTAAEVLNEIMISFKVKPSIISIHDIHVMLQKCPGNENLYSLAEDKSLVINDRNVAIEKAFQKLQAHCAEQSSIGGFVAEFASSSLDIELYRFEDLLNGALVLLIVAPEAIRTARNLQRPGKRVPSEIVKGYADCLDDMTIHVLSNCGAKIIKVSSDCPYELFKTRITNSYKLYYNAEYFSKQEIY
jgi:tetratricopeptide (TPR) repeat protein